MKFFPKVFLAFFLFVSVLVFGPHQAVADEYLYSRQGKVDVGLGAGMTFNSPVRFALELYGEYFYTNNIAFGAALDTLIRSPHIFIFRPFARYHFDISRYPKLVPYVGGGLGAGADTNGNGIMDIMLPNFGFKYAIANRIYLGSDLGLHILTDFDDTRLDFQVLFVVLSYRF